MFVATIATKKILALKKRLRCIQGGTSAGKTIGILQYLIDEAQRDKNPTLTSIVSESFPHLKRGAMRDFLMMMQDAKYYKDNQWNRSDFTYTFETGSKIEFFSADQPGKVRGPRRQRLFINEANNIPFETYEQLEVRTSDYIILDWNPVAEFWAYEHLINAERDDVEHLILTYKDNEALAENIVKSIEQRKGRKGWWRVYGQGLLGEVEGKIYRGWEIVDEVPRGARLERRGLDYGYSLDPAALYGIYYYDGGYILDEEMYQVGMSNKRISDTIEEQESPQVLVVADSAEPKSIDEMKGYGINITGAQKGKDSINYGIGLIQDQQVSMTKRSVNLIREYRNYLWQVDKDGNILNVPEKRNDHAMDAIRYGLTALLRKPTVKNIAQSTPTPSFYGTKDMPF